MPELPGSFGKYFLCDKIATGGMAELYLAKLIGPGGFEKQLVIKQINPELSRERQFVDLFVAEAKTLVSLSHGNIVPVYELGVVDDTYFIAMEYVDGPTLGELMAGLAAREGWAEPAVAAYVASELCKGLDYAHRKGEGVIHRDLSPRNVLLSRDGEVKLVDFGLALAGRRAHHARPGAGLPAGSFPYMSPEQVRREPLDRRSDLFSLGVLLWEMLTGARLFAADGPDATLEAVLRAPIATPSTVASGVPAELDRICLGALARERDERYASASEIFAALSRFAYSVEPPVTQAALATLVARVCPPLARGDPTRGDAASDATGAASDAARAASDATGVASDAARAANDAAVLRTRPLRSPGRPPAMRTFATSDEFDQVLANATPLLPFPALPRALAPRAADAAEPLASAARPEPRRPPARRRRRWIAACLAAVGTGLAALALILSGGEPASSTGPESDRGPIASMSRNMNPSPSPSTASISNVNPPPVLVPNDASASAPTSHASAVSSAAIGDSAARSTEEAPTAPSTEAPPISQRERQKRGRGTLRVGANPWADVYLDGALLGQAPGAWSVAAGVHSVELRHRSHRRSFRVSIAPGQTEAIGLVDFSVPE